MSSSTERLGPGEHPWFAITIIITGTCWQKKVGVSGKAGGTQAPRGSSPYSSGPPSPSLGAKVGSDGTPAWKDCPPFQALSQAPLPVQGTPDGD